jgi:hypothetical protein
MLVRTFFESFENVRRNVEQASTPPGGLRLRSEL